VRRLCPSPGAFRSAGRKLVNPHTRSNEGLKRFLFSPLFFTTHIPVKIRRDQNSFCKKPGIPKADSSDKPPTSGLERRKKQRKGIVAPDEKGYKTHTLTRAHRTVQFNQILSSCHFAACDGFGVFERQEG